MKKILIVDDEKDFVELLEDYFQNKDYETAIAYNLKEAENQIKAFKPFLILLDIKLPDGHGVDFLKKIKKKYPNIEIIMVTGLSDKEIALKSLDYGAADYVTKPIDLNYLETSIISRIIDNYGAKE